MVFYIVINGLPIYMALTPIPIYYVPDACLQDPNSLSGKAPQRKISGNLKAARLVVDMITSIFKLRGVQAALLPGRL